jgi:hypothetical protein
MKKGKEKNTMREEYDFTGGIRGKYAKRFSDCRNKGERRGRSRGTKGTFEGNEGDILSSPCQEKR